MNDPSDLAKGWVRHLPSHLLTALISALHDGPAAVETLRHGSHGPVSRAALDAAYALASSGDGPYVAGLITGYQDARREQPTVTPVWTGPESSAGAGSRLTLAVVASLIDEARSEILLVSYATAPSVEVRDALDRAARRGVTITALLERAHDNPAFTGSPDPLNGIQHSALRWPMHAREPGASMHAKILVIDRTSALIGSANLTGHAVERNLECGLLIRGGAIPATLVEHIRNMDDLSPEVGDKDRRG